MTFDIEHPETSLKAHLLKFGMKVFNILNMFGNQQVVQTILSQN